MLHQPPPAVSVLRPLPLAPATALALLACVLTACGEAPPAPPSADEVPPPPSLRAEAAEVVRPVRLDAEQAADLAIATVTVRAEAVPVVVALAGAVEPSPEAFAVVAAPIAGRVVRVPVHEGESVRAGQTVAVLESLEFAGLVADALQARAELAFAEQQVARYTDLVAKRISPRAQLERAEADRARAAALVNATEARLAALGVGAAALDRYAEGGRPTLTLTAPRAGVIHAHRIDLGQAVQAYDELLTLVDRREVLVRGLATPEEAARLAPGDAVRIAPVEDSEAAVEATVTRVAPALDAATRAVPVYVRTRASALRPGQRVRLTVTTAATAPALHVPLAAVTYDGDRALVYVRTAPNTFLPTPVTLGDPDGGRVVVRDGLAEGDVVATTQVFSLKALGRFEQYGEE